jgi:SM-20-related protein
MNEELYSQITDALVSHGYIVISDALAPDLTHKLLELAQDETNYKKAGISSAKEFHIDSSKRSDKTRWLYEDDDTQSRFLAFTQCLQEYLNRSLYLGLSYYEAHFAIYDKGDFYEKHLDAFVGSKNRVVTSVFYLNEEWTQDDGGELYIYDENNQLLTTLLPQANSLVVFLSDKFPHEVKSAHKKRYSIAGWFRVDK